MCTVHFHAVTFVGTERCTVTPLCGAVGSRRLALSPNPAAAVAADLLELHVTTRQQKNNAKPVPREAGRATIVCAVIAVVPEVPGPCAGGRGIAIPGPARPARAPPSAETAGSRARRPEP